MKKILMLFVAIIGFTSCDDLTSLNDNPKRSAIAPAGSLFANAQKNLMDDLTSPNVNLNIFRLLAQHWTETTYTDESNFDLSTRNIPQNWWHALYRDVIQDLREAKKIAEADEDLDPAVLTNQLAMIEILEVYAWSILVDTFGDIPYSDALKVTASDNDILTPTYEDASTVYTNLVVRLNMALSNLDNSVESWGENDLIYGGEVDLWIKLGNSIKLKIGMTLADVSSATAKTIVEEAAPNAFSSNNDNAIFLYKSAPPNTNPIWVNLVQSGRKDFVVTSTIVDVMNGLSDPRIPYYFTEDADGGYSGGQFGESNSYATFSKPGDIVDNSDFPALLMDYSEVEFYLAEALERGYAVGGTPEGHYNNAIKASMEYWGVKSVDIDTYLLLPEVAYATAGATFQEKIGNQKWLALYNRGFESWTEWRRLDYPLLVPGPTAQEDGLIIPLRYTYPVSEQNLNTINYDAASAAIGGDDVATKLFWDMN